MLAKLAGKDTQTVITALIKQAKKLPKELYKSLTWDRGKELTDHRRFILATRQLSEVITVEVKQIERDHHDLFGPPLDFVLQHREVRGAVR
jgi:hypothetical protein